MKRKPAAAKKPSADSAVSILNHQRTRSIDRPRLRRVVQYSLVTLLNLPEFDLVVHLVNETEMTRINESRLRHAGSTDVITFDFSGGDTLAGELFICVDEALLQAKRFKVAWQEELVRYIVHGILHLQGYDDTRPAPCRRMKKEENRLVRILARDFDLSKVWRKPRVSV